MIFWLHVLAIFSWSTFLFFPLLQLYEIDVDTEFMKASDAACDVACLMYNVNDPKSFNYCACIYKVSITSYPEQQPQSLGRKSAS